MNLGMHIGIRPIAVAACIYAVTALGCESKPYGLAPVSGIVTLDGQPVSGVRVTFQPTGRNTENPGPGSSAFCDVSGRYELQTVRGEPGAVPGQHTVRILNPEAKKAGSDDSAGPPRKEIIPRHYEDGHLTFDVPPDGTDAANFELTSK
jgi:hypothetical protein